VAQQALGQPHRRPVPDAARGPALGPEVDLAAQEGAGGEHDGARVQHRTALVDHAGHAPVLRQDEVDRLALGDLQPGLLASRSRTAWA
jgi:hypothetical protein